MIPPAPAAVLGLDPDGETAQSLIADLDVERAAQVLFMVTGDEGYEPGSFYRSLYDAMSKADPQNLALLGVVYPAAVLAFSVAAYVPGGVDVLRERVRRG